MSDRYFFPAQPLRTRRRVPFWLWPIALLGIAALGAVMLLAVRPHIEDDLTTRAQTALRNVGATEVNVDVSGRDVHLTGKTPPHLTAEQVRSAVAAVEGVREVTAEYSEPAAPSTAASVVPPSPAVLPSPSAHSANTTLPMLTIAVLPETLSVSGHVPTQQSKAAIISAAEKQFTPGRVSEQLMVVPGGSEEGLDAVPQLLKALGPKSAVTLTLNEGTLTLVGTVVDEAHRTATAQAAEAVTGDSGTVTNELVVGFPTSYSTSTGQLQLNRLDQIVFDEGSDVLTADGKRIVAQAANILKGHPSWEVEVEAHTDDTGNPAANKELSDRRAAVVVKELVRLGISSSRLTAEGLGQTRPLVPNDSDANRAINRRIQFEVE